MSLVERIRNIKTRDKILLGVLAILAVLVLLSPFADPNPDGLESAAEQYGTPEGETFDLGFLTDYGSEDSLLYQLLSNTFLTTIVSGIIGIIVVMVVFFVPWYFIRQRSDQKEPQGSI
ncbi:MAG: PDGLE domain-containing protein [Candidatus Hodarchaeota archaeon]